MTALTLAIGSASKLAAHVARQLDQLMPHSSQAADMAQLMPHINPALLRLRPVLAAVRAFDASHFNHFNALQYASFLYLLANQVWRQTHADGSQVVLADRLFCLNRALNAIDLFYAVQMPEVFFLSHGLGTVLGQADYGERLVVFQNVTVGRVGDARPRIGSNVVLYPGAVVTGASVIGDGCVVSAGTVVHGVQVPANMLVLSQAGALCFVPRRKDYSGLYLNPA